MQGLACDCGGFFYNERFERYLEWVKGKECCLFSFLADKNHEHFQLGFVCLSEALN